MLDEHSPTEPLTQPSMIVLRHIAYLLFCVCYFKSNNKSMSPYYISRSNALIARTLFAGGMFCSELSCLPLRINIMDFIYA